MILVQFSKPWVSRSSEIIGFGLLPPLVVAHIATFYSVSQGLSLVQILPPTPLSMQPEISESELIKTLS